VPTRAGRLFKYAAQIKAEVYSAVGGDDDRDTAGLGADERRPPEFGTLQLDIQMPGDPLDQCADGGGEGRVGRQCCEWHLQLHVAARYLLK
jgi:hypothetical protein